MKRLTIRNSDGRARLELHRDKGRWSVSMSGTPITLTGDAVDRLAAYEDTGMEPEEIVGLQKQNDLLAQYGAQKFSASMEDFREINGLKLKIQSLEMSLSVACDGLNKYTQAEQEGRLVVLPCKVGDTVYRVWKTRGREPVVTAHYMTDIGMVVRWMHYFGETVFLTREEAERALEGGVDHA